MKICTYCDSIYDLNEAECPSCGALDYKYRCDSCHTVHMMDACPNCGKSNKNKLTNPCLKCGHQTSDRICPICGYDSMSQSSIKDSVTSVIAKGTCKLTGHKWQGCKCTRCGETRNTGHDYKLVPNKCEEKCTICGSKKEIEHLWSNESCIRCGANMSYFDKKWNNLNDKLPFLNLNKKENRVFFLFGLYLIVFFTFLSIMAFIESTPDSEGKIMLPSVVASFEDKNFEDVAKDFKEAGFTNIKLVATGDLVLGWLNSEGEVSSILINGTKEIDRSVRYAVDTEIIIEYHSFPINDDQETKVVVDKPKEDSKTDTYVYTGQQYEIVDSYETGIGLTQFWIYTSKFDLSTEDYKIKVKEIITDLVKKSMTTDIVVEIVTDKEIIYFESNNTITEYMNKYGDKYYRDTVVPKEKEGYVASYTGGYDSDASKLSTSDSAYVIIWLIASDEPEFEYWKPELNP